MIDKRADAAAVLVHPVRKRIRDVLRINGSLTLSELAKAINQSEQNTYHHLSKLIDAGVVTKVTEKLNGRLVSFYSLSEDYFELFSFPKPDLRPIYALAFVYVILTIASYFNPQVFSPLYSIFGITYTYIFYVHLGGLIVTVIIMFYSIIYYRVIVNDRFGDL